MPPLATHQLDLVASNLISAWIASAVTNQSFADWQIAHFGSTNAPNAAANADPDGDGANNYLEYLTQTDPQNAGSVWKLAISSTAGPPQITIGYSLVPNLGTIIETSSNLVSWTTWDVSGNVPFFASTPGTTTLTGPPYPSSMAQFFRARFIVP